jgi:hypothetical protein
MKENRLGRKVIHMRREGEKKKRSASSANIIATKKLKLYHGLTMINY